MSTTSRRLGPEAPVLERDGIRFRDLNKNGRLDPYEDPRAPIEERVEDLLSQMTLEEKAGLMFHPSTQMSMDGTLREGDPAWALVEQLLINHVIVYQIPLPREMAQWVNELQRLAERTRLGIPVTLSSDPRHGFTDNPGAGSTAGALSQWPEPIGLGATRDASLVREFGDIARREYRALGISVALHPMADVCSEPRWARSYGTFGEDAALVSEMVEAYVRGFQGDELGAESVACMSKHFPGGGPQKDGEDPHFPYGKEQVYPGGRFEYHLSAFEGAFRAGTAQMMPYYGMPVGLPGVEEVGFGYNRGVVTDLLRERFGFDGVVCTDWGLVTEEWIGGKIIHAKCWGVEELGLEERLLKILEAGCDQLGGEQCSDVLAGLVRGGRVSEERLDVSARRILRDKFRLGLFDHPYVDPEAAERIVGNPDFRRAGELAQRKAIVLLRNTQTAEGPLLPLTRRPRLYVEGINPQVAAEYGEVAGLEDAELAIIRLRAPFEPRDESFLEVFFHAGDLDFKEPERSRILALLERIPTIVDIHLDRPAVFPEIAQKSVALLASFGAADAAVLDVVFGRFGPQGKLPFEVPSSMEAVRRQKEDVPCDSEQPLFAFGHGLSYE
ncbi:MAG: glycoside hydrolase family 3 protein [Gaiellaceae bacterium]